MQIAFITELILNICCFVKGVYFFNVRFKKCNSKVINMELLIIKSGEGDLV